MKRVTKQGGNIPAFAEPDTLTITDNRTGKTYEVPIPLETINAIDLRQIKAKPDDFGLMTFDPGYTNTAHCKSNITLIDGDKGSLRYRGYPMEQLAEKASFLEVAYLIMFGELPNKAQLEEWTNNIVHHTFLHENAKTFLDGFRYDAHPMGVFISTVAALSTFYPEASRIDDPVVRQHQVHRLIAKTPTLAAFCYRHMRGLPYAYPDNDLSYAGNFLNMLHKTTEAKYVPNPVLDKALYVLFILHADHEQNCSAAAMRGIGSSHVDPYSAMAGAAAALYGPLHGHLPLDIVRPLIEKSTFRATVPLCVCREAFHCKTYPHHLACMVLGASLTDAEQFGMKRLTVEEAIAPVEKAVGLGLTPTIIWETENQTVFGWPRDKGLAICFCCNCCCDYRLGLRVGTKAFRKKVFRPEGVSLIVSDACVLCGSCADPAVCSVSAVTLGAKKSEINLDLCVGCGACVKVCPEKAISFYLDPEVDVVGRLLAKVGEYTSIS